MKFLWFIHNLPMNLPVKAELKIPWYFMVFANRWIPWNWLGFSCAMKQTWNSFEYSHEIVPLVHGFVGFHGIFHGLIAMKYTWNSFEYSHELLHLVQHFTGIPWHVSWCHYHEMYLKSLCAFSLVFHSIIKECNYNHVYCINYFIIIGMQLFIHIHIYTHTLLVQCTVHCDCCGINGST